MSMRERIRNRTGMLAGMAFMIMSPGMAYSEGAVQGASVLGATAGLEQAGLEQIALAQPEEVLDFRQHKLDAGIKAISSVESTEGRVTNETSPVLVDELKAGHNKPVAEKKTLVKTPGNRWKMLNNKNQKGRKINTRGVGMIRRMLWMTLFYSGSK